MTKEELADDFKIVNNVGLDGVHRFMTKDSRPIPSAEYIAELIRVYIPEMNNVGTLVRGDHRLKHRKDEVFSTHYFNEAGNEIASYSVDMCVLSVYPEHRVWGDAYKNELYMKETA